MTRVADENILIRKAARAIADGAVVGWFQGCMEWGRAWTAAAEIPVYAVSFALVFIFLRPINQFIYFQF